MSGYGPALAQQDRRIEELESKCERLISSCERTESERDEAKRARDAATAEAERLKKAIQDYLDGNYPNPRTHRPKCKHGTWYYEACEECIDAHFRAALTPAPSP